jgi:hypothetical protein
MWNNPKPAPEYQWGWRDKAAARASLRAILQWVFERVILAHGDLMETDARQRVEHAWKVPLTDERANRGPIAGPAGLRRAYSCSFMFIRVCKPACLSPGSTSCNKAMETQMNTNEHK